jgi:AraC-like DNA-binding protein
MVTMNRFTLLSATADLTVSRFDHPPHGAHEDPEREVAAHWGLAFVDAGSFEVRLDGSSHRLAVGSVLLTRPGLEFACHHGEACPSDVCLVVRFDPAAVAELADPWYRPGALALRRATPRLSLVHRRLAVAVAAGDGFETERWGLATLTALTADTGRAPLRGAYRSRRADLDAVLAVCRAIEADPAARVSVASRAQAVQLTGTRLTHAFARYLGVSPHQYVVRWRLACAAELLDSGGSVSNSCYGAGFENLSHFCRTFQRVLGSRPSLWRTIGLSERRRKVQAMLGGPS